mgnify:CR=1 FL=1
MRATARVLIAVSLLAAGAGSGCNQRKPLPRKPDAGPVVEMVEARPPGLPQSATGSAAATVPLLAENEPNDDVEHAQLLTAGQGIRGSLAAPTSLGAGKGYDDYFVFRSEATRQQLRAQAEAGAARDPKTGLYSRSLVIERISGRIGTQGQAKDKDCASESCSSRAIAARSSSTAIRRAS